MSTRFNLVSNDGEPSSITVFFDDRPSKVATRNHPNFDRICSGVEEGSIANDELFDLFNIGYALDRRFTALSDRVTVNNGKVFFDGVEQDNALTQAIIRFYSAGNDNFIPLVLFMEKIEQNPQQHSRENLFRWMSKHEFGICDNGDFIAYKGVAFDQIVNMGNPLFRSKTQGTAYVNGEKYTGYIPNNPNTIVTMPRDQVAFDPSQGCSAGLHVANWAFARGYATTVVQVKVNPRDVVSVPTDSGDQKMRVCRYRVLKAVTVEDTEPLYVGDVEKTARVVAPRPDRVVKGGTSRASILRKHVSGRITKKRDLPRHYEDFSADDFASLPRRELRWLKGEWGVKTTDKSKLVEKLTAKAVERRKIA